MVSAEQRPYRDYRKNSGVDDKCQNSQNKPLSSESTCLRSSKNADDNVGRSKRNSVLKKAQFATVFNFDLDLLPKTMKRERAYSGGFGRQAMLATSLRSVVSNFESSIDDDFGGLSPILQMESDDSSTTSAPRPPILIIPIDTPEKPEVPQ